MAVATVTVTVNVRKRRIIDPLEKAERIMDYKEGYLPDLDLKDKDGRAVLISTVERFNRGDECWCLIPWRTMCFWIW